MKLVIFLTVAMVLAATAVSPDSRGDSRSNPELNERWELYKTKFNKSYSTPAIEARRRALWEDAVAMIDEHNRKYQEGKTSYTMAENHLADMTDLEARNNMYLEDV